MSHFDGMSDYALAEYLQEQEHKLHLLIYSPKCDGETLRVQLLVTNQAIGMIEREQLKRYR